MPIPPNPSEARYGEPWRARYLDTGDLPLIQASNGQTLQQGFWSTESRESTVRAVECVNACQGITDPAEALKEAKAALTLFHQVFNAQPPTRIGGWNWSHLADQAAKALAALSPQMP